MAKAPTGTVTFLLSDIADSTGLWDASPTHMAEAMLVHDRILREVLDRHDGLFIKHTGDGVCAAFSRVTAAAHTALDCRHSLEGQTWPARAPLRVRIVLHTGECFERDHDYFGSPLCIARRLVEVTPPDSIWTTGVFAQLLRRAPHDDMNLVSIGTRQLRGLSLPIEVFQLTQHQSDVVDVAFLETG
jgi:class 3 adenylate cyclase